MSTHYKELMTTKSDAGLLEYITKANRYTPEAIAAAVAELAARGRNLSHEERDALHVTLAQKVDDEKEEKEQRTGKGWSKNVVTDPNAPLFYSPRAVWGFSVFFSTIFGAVLLASNLENKKHKWIVIAFGIALSLLAIVVGNAVEGKFHFVLGLNIGGALGLNTTLCNKYIGKDVKFRAKPIWKALIISLVITAPFILALIYSQPS